MKPNQVIIIFLKENIFILIIISVIFLYLGIKAFDENGWDGWGFGSAQTLMSSKYWARDGFAKNYFLFIPSTYSKLIPYLDEPEFRNRTIDDFGGALKRNRIYYTHYPPLYLIPYALLSKTGIENRAIFRIFATIISLAALFLFYLFIKAISTRTIAIVASTYYGFSVTFLNYADSLANQPFTIIFTFLILYLSVLALCNFTNTKIYLRYNSAIWLTYLILALSSYDTTFFVFAWLILYDVIVLKKFLWRKWLFWACAPLLGFVLQILQNAWYLGWIDTWRDIYTSYTGRAIGSLKGFILGLIAPFVSVTGIKTFYIFKKTFLALGGAVLIFAILKYSNYPNYGSKIKFQINNNFFKIIFVLAIAAVIQPLFINVTGYWPYQGVLTAPFWSLLMGTSTVFIFNILKQKDWDIIKTRFFWTLTLVVLTIWTFQFYNTFTYAKDWPNNKPDQKVIEFSKEIKNFHPGEEKIAFRIIPKNPIWKSQFPTFNMEYYMGMPIIDFANSRDLLVDFWWFRNRSEYPFHSFIISESKTDAEKIRRELSTKNIDDISAITEIQGQYLFTVGSN